MNTLFWKLMAVVGVLSALYVGHGLHGPSDGLFSAAHAQTLVSPGSIQGEGRLLL